MSYIQYHFTNIFVNIYTTLYNTTTSLFHFIFKTPLFKLYMKGPAIIGCWENSKYPDICSRLTGSSANFWFQNIVECEQIIQNKFESYFIFASLLIYLLVLYKIIYILWWRYFVYKPLLSDISRIINNSMLIKDKH